MSRLPCLLLCAVACGEGSAPAPTPLILASTTSTQDSGLLDVLVPAFEATHPAWDVQVVAVGTGEALKLGERGDADVLLVHAPEAEARFVADGHGTERRAVMHNDFVVVCPEALPDGIRPNPDATRALAAIAANAVPFVSRGDDSGTHKRELALWQAAGVEPTGEWYLSVGQGMGDTLRIASEKQAYTLADRATWLNLSPTLDLSVAVEGDPPLHNPYGVIPVARARHPDGARAFAAWITAPEAQALIGAYGVERWGQALFVPDAG